MLGLRWFHRGGQVVGVDIGAGAVKVVRLSRGRNRVVLESAGLTEIASDQAFQPAWVSEALRKLLSGAGIAPKGLVTAVPGRDATIRSLLLPKMPREELREALRWEVKKHIHFPLEEAQLDYLVMREIDELGTKKYEVLLVAVEKETVRSHLEYFRGVGEVRAVDLNALAVAEAYRWNHAPEGPPEAENVMVVDIGAGKTEISLLKQGMLRFTRYVPSGGNAITEALQKTDPTMTFSQAETLKRTTEFDLLQGSGERIDALRPTLDRLIVEIQRSLDYYRAQFRERTLQEVVLTGGGSLLKGFREYLASYFDCPVKLDNPFAKIHVGRGMPNLQEDLPRFSVALGLALRKE